MKIDYKKIRDEARAIAVKEAPTEYGMFDARLRLETYIGHCLERGLIVMLGCSFLLNDGEVEKALHQLNLDLD